MKRTISMLAVIAVSTALLASLLAIELANKNSEIASLNNHIENLTSQISSLQADLSNLRIVKSANLVTALGIAEVGNTSELTNPYNRLYIAGSVSNNGSGAALNTGLHVTAYNTDGKLEINMTVPLDRGMLGTNDAINSYIVGLDPYSAAPKFGNLVSGGTANVNLNIYHEGVLRNWAVTPVWTNTP